MNYLAQRFVDLWNKIDTSFDLLRYDLHGIRDAIHEQSGATRDANAAEHTEKSSEPLPIIVINGIETHKSAADHKEEGEYQNRNLFWQKSTFWAVVIYAGLTALQAYLTFGIANTSQKTYAATVRPYIGIEKIKLSHVWVNNEGVQIEETEQTKNTVEMDVEIIVRNFGNVPGEDFATTYKIFSDGKEVHVAGPPVIPTNTLFPTEFVTLKLHVFQPDYFAIMRGDKILGLDVYIRYKGQKERCEREQYVSKMNSFGTLGSTCGALWRPLNY